MENIEEKFNLTIERADSVSALSDFYCGVKPLDDFIHNLDNGLDFFIKKHLTNLWIVFNHDEPIAFFALSKSNLVINNLDKQTLLNHYNWEIDEDIFLKKSSYPSVEIDYFAIKNTYRNKGIGRLILSEITNKVLIDKLSATMFLTLEAYNTPSYSSVNFYKKCEFQISEHGMLQNQYKERYGERSLTIRMYKTLFPGRI